MGVRQASGCLRFPAMGGSKFFRLNISPQETVQKSMRRIKVMFVSLPPVFWLAAADYG